MAVCSGCSSDSPNRHVNRSFYYWKTVFQPSGTEKHLLQQLKVQHIYLKLFDVEWNASSQQAMPVAKSIFKEKPEPHIIITPVVYITQEVLQHTDSNSVDQLSLGISELVQSIISNNHLSVTSEIQLDCDWTSSTSQPYFHLLKQLKQQPFFSNRQISATIRLHQLKFVSENGVPPVDKGLLMSYNMGNLRDAKTSNSIIDVNELKQYTSNLEHYPLPLDIALPVFEWWVLFERNEYKGLLRHFNATAGQRQEKRIHFKRDTIINGMQLHAGNWLRHEKSDMATVQACAEHISKKLKSSKQLSVILFHLDQKHLSNYTLHELETIYNSFR